MHAWQQDLVRDIGAAESLDAIRQACARAQAAAGAVQDIAQRDVQAADAGQGHRIALATALHEHLQRACAAPAFRYWVDTYFGRRPVQFRHPLQRPTYLYYPALSPVAWHKPEDRPQWEAMRGLAHDAAIELKGFSSGFDKFKPYVGEEARNDATWHALSGRNDWSSLHLLKPGQAAQLLERLPRVSALLEAAPLAQCLPHAPECFVSRLAPGVQLPPHHGLSNIKLTVHVPVDLPADGCSITVGGQTRCWKMDELLVFDDSFLHSAANRSTQPRTVMIFDIWHPDLGEDERTGLAHAIAVLDAVNQLPAT